MKKKNKKLTQFDYMKKIRKPSIKPSFAFQDRRTKLKKKIMQRENGQ